MGDVSMGGDPFAKDKINLDSMLQEQIFEEQMNRTMLYYGEDAFKKIRQSFVIVVGLGGVGGAAAHVLLRSGVKKIRLIDPEVEVEAFQTFFTGDMAEQLLSGKPDYVLDCIDNTETKVQLLTFCKRNNIPVISSFGAGSSSDPTKINICDLSFTFGCPFGKEVRKLLRENGITTGIICVCSTETHRKKLIPLTAEEAEALKTQVKSTLRIRTLGVSMPIPFIFGTTMGNTCLNGIVGLPMIVEEERRAPPPMAEYNKMLKTLIKKEQIFHNTSPILLKKIVDATNLRYIVDQVYDGKSGVSLVSKAIFIVVRWRPELPVSLSNLVVLTDKECAIHEKLTRVEDHYTPEIIARIDNLLASKSETSSS
eukprot:gene12075-14127_t